MDPKPRLVLASASPRRRQLLDLIGIPYVARPSDVDEKKHPDESPSEYALRAARDKAESVARQEDGSRPVLGSDTVVEIDGIALGKPADREDARRMLRQLSGRTHQVHTGMALVTDSHTVALLDTADVRFHRLTEPMINWYVATGEPLDKAGAYAVQGRGGLLVAGVDGSPHTVVGLPIHRLPELFERGGLEFWALLDQR